jgi:hypothetical protein
VVARTCLTCGRFADGDSFPILNRGRPNETRRRTCHHCTNALKKKNREERGIGLPTPPRPPEELQTSKYRHWTKEEDDFLRDNLNAMGYEDMARALGRSLDSIYTRRGILGLARVRRSHRVAQPWVVRK